VNQHTIVRVYDETISIVDAKWKKGAYHFSMPVTCETLQEAHLYLASKKNIHLLFFTDDIVEESITLPAVVKNEATLLSALTVKIHDERLINQKLIFNKFRTLLDSTGESATHRYEGLYEKDILSAIAYIPHLEHLKHVTTERYALFSISEKALSGKNYLCAYAQEDKNLIIAVSNGELLFSRMGMIQGEDSGEKFADQINDIGRTLAYAHQQYREANFECILICGIIADAEIVPIQLQAMTGLNVTVIAPSLLSKGLARNTSQDYILELGMLYLDEIKNFLPDRVKAAREFYLGRTITMAIAFIFMLAGLYQSAAAYTAYQESLDEHDRIETKLFQTLRHTQTLDEAQLQEIVSQLKSSTPLHHHLIDDVIIFDPVLQLLKPHSVAFEEKAGKGKLTMVFKHEYKTLLDLYLFEKKFKQTVLGINSPLQKLASSYKIDYNTLVFESALTMGETEQAAPPPRRRHKQ
jgi:hypothetical protein